MPGTSTLPQTPSSRADTLVSRDSPAHLAMHPEIPSRLLCSRGAIQLLSGLIDDPACGWFKQADAALSARPDQETRIDGENARDRDVWAAMGRVLVEGVQWRMARRQQAPQRNMRLVQQQLTVRP